MSRHRWLMNFATDTAAFLTLTAVFTAVVGGAATLL